MRVLKDTAAWCAWVVLTVAIVARVALGAGLTIEHAEIVTAGALMGITTCWAVQTLARGVWDVLMRVAERAGAPDA